MNAWPMRTRLAPLPGATDKRVPPSALLISLLALVVAALGNFLWPDRLPQVFALLWLLALIPPLLLAYYKGWEGACLALAAGMVLIIGVEVGGSYLGDRQIRWWILGAVIVMLVTVSLGVGMISEMLHRKASEALDLAYSDHLTGLPNRRILDMFLGKAFAAAQRGDRLSVALFDIDGFKRLNDTRGHAAGDQALRLVAALLAANTRASDISGRLGGDEFLTVLAGEGPAAARAFADRVLQLTRSVKGDARAQGIVLSAGIASYGPSMATPEDLLEAADRALYAAKDRGGDRVIIQVTDRAGAGGGDPQATGGSQRAARKADVNRAGGGAPPEAPASRRETAAPGGAAREGGTA